MDRNEINGQTDTSGSEELQSLISNAIKNRKPIPQPVAETSVKTAEKAAEKSAETVGEAEKKLTEISGAANMPDLKFKKNGAKLPPKQNAQNRQSGQKKKRPAPQSAEGKPVTSDTAVKSADRKKKPVKESAKTEGETKKSPKKQTAVQADGKATKPTDKTTGGTGSKKKRPAATSETTAKTKQGQQAAKKRKPESDVKSPKSKGEKKSVGKALKDKQSKLAAALAAKTAAGAISENPTDTAAGADESSGKLDKIKKKWSLKKKTGVALGIIFLVFMIVLALLVGLFLHWTGLLNRDGDTTINSGSAPLNSSDMVDAEDTFDKAEKEAELMAELKKNSTKISSEDVTNILLIGEDVRDTATDDRGNTDVMMIISLNTAQKTITMTSLMRDMYIYMSEFNDSGKLNAAYWHGGAEYLEEVIEDYYGIEIDRYVKVNFMQFIDVVEAVGGLELTVAGNEAEAMDAPLSEQNRYLEYDSGTDYLDKSLFPTEDTEVTMTLNGNQALAYARIRYNCGDDYARTKRQRIVIQEIIKKSKELNILELNSLINKVFPEVETDITDGEIASLLLNAFDYMNYDVQELRIPADGYFTDEVIDRMSVLSVDFTANAAIIQYVIYGDATNVEEAIEMYRQSQSEGTFYGSNQTADAYSGYSNGYEGY